MNSQVLDSPSTMKHEIWADRLASAFDAGVLVVDDHDRVQFVNERARGFLGVSSSAEVERDWRRLVDRPTVRVRSVNLDHDESRARLLIIEPADRASALETAFRHASRDRSLASLFRHLAHDLKGLLNVLSMNLEILSHVSAKSGALPADQSAIASRSAASAKRGLERLDRTIDAVLDRAWIDQSAPRRFDMRVTCRALVDLVTPRAERQHVTVSLAAPDFPLDVLGYSDQLHNALLNLFVNALDAMPQGGSLRVEMTGGSGPTAAPSVQITICDTGQGIASDVLDRMWNVHYTTKPGATGIGLPVARAVVESHGGQTTFRPNPHGGSCFVVELPSAPSSS